MCGIFGWFSQKNRVDRTIVEAMRDMIKHRGPDDSGVYMGEYDEAGMGFRRLAIIDLSINGHQPMCNEDGSVWLIFNGEIYNYQEIRPLLEQTGHKFRSQSDTEVIIHAYEEWGVDCLERFNGMFALAIWDTRKNQVFAARDRIGIKPMYYAARDGELMLASELKAMHGFPGFSHEINSSAILDYLRFGYISAPDTIYQDIFHLPPGHFLLWDRESATLKTRPYWDIREKFSQKRKEFSARNMSEEDVLEELDDLLKQSVKRRMISDVPLGAFLSGGIDSSLIVSIMQAISPNPVQTYTIRFDEARYNEADHAAKIAQTLGTQHHEFKLTMDEGKAVIPHLAHFYDEPFSDKSAIPTFLISKLAREYVTVALSGDGGDELFAGYNTYQWPLRYGSLWQSLTPMRPALKSLEKIQWLPPNVQKRLSMFASSSPTQMFDNRVSLWQNSEIQSLVPDFYGSESRIDYPETELADLLDSCMLRDIQHYLPNDILTKVDRASMATSLEVRVPILDHTVVEFASALPLEYKVRDGKRKYLLKQELARYLSPNLTERPKQGFSVPIGEWLRGDLSYLLDDHLNPDSLKTYGVLSPDLVAKSVQRFRDGQETYERVWNLLTLQMWFDSVAQPNKVTV